MRWLLGVGVVLCVATCCALDALPWWQTAVLYQVYPRSFKDSDGDGLGDIKGIAEMAGYFKYLGVDAIWVSPIYESPMVDFGYDISNYTAIAPMFGTMDDFMNLVSRFHELGIKLLMDLVPNHTSDQHIWFQKSKAREDPYTDYYIWTDGKKDPKTGNYTPPNNWLSVATDASSWQWCEERQQFYYHAFLPQQPDLNYRNANVIKEIQEVLKFWLDLGVDGFRVDAAGFLMESTNLTQNEFPNPGTTGSDWHDINHTCTVNYPDTAVVLNNVLAEFLVDYTAKNNKDSSCLFLEVRGELSALMRYYGQGNTSLMQPFNFNLFLQGSQAMRASTVKNITDSWMQAMPAGAAPNWPIGSHDTMRASDRYGHEMVDAMNILTFVLSGVKITYNGEEIGMQNTFVRTDQLKDPWGTRDPERTPIQWDDSLSSGFSTNSTTWLPVNPNYWWLNVAAQKTAESSHLKVFQAMAQARKNPVLQRGDMKVLAPDNDTLVVVRSYNGSHFVLLINMGSETKYYTSQNLFTPQGIEMDMAVTVVSTNTFSILKSGDTMRKNSLSVKMRPKSAVLLKSPPDVPSSAASLPFSWTVCLILSVAVIRSTAYQVSTGS